MKKMQPWAKGSLFVLGLAMCWTVMHAQKHENVTGAAESKPIAGANAPAMTTVDVVALNAKTYSVVPNLTVQDFTVKDDGRLTPVLSFRSGMQYQEPPIALWLVLECNNYGVTDFASAFMRGKTQYLLPALAHLDKADVAGVAHWCGDGKQAIDLMPGHNPQAAINALNNVLKQRPTEGTNRQAEDAKERMVHLILTQAKTMRPEHTPVIVFLYGDAGSAFQYQAESTLINLLSEPDFVYGLNDAGYHLLDPNSMRGAGRVNYEIHYLSLATGGNVYGTPYAKKFSTALDYILLQMHFRYTLGFMPQVMDSKRHDLKIELTPAAAKKFPGVVLRYRAQYIPAPGPLMGPS